MRTLFLAALLASCGALAADYRLDPGAAVQDRYRIHVKLLEGARVVAEEEVRYPD
jgi:hypothetical protein